MEIITLVTCFCVFPHNLTKIFSVMYDEILVNLLTTNIFFFGCVNVQKNIILCLTLMKNDYKLKNNFLPA